MKQNTVSCKHHKPCSAFLPVSNPELTDLSSATRLRIAQLLIIITPAIWSTNYIVARTAPGVIEPHLLAFLRWLFAFLLMLPLAWTELRRQWPHWIGEWKDLLVLGGLGMWICGAFVYIGGETTEAINIGLIYSPEGHCRNYSVLISPVVTFGLLLRCLAGQFIRYCYVCDPAALERLPD